MRLAVLREALVVHRRAGRQQLREQQWPAVEERLQAVAMAVHRSNLPTTQVYHSRLL
jgi:hypothetical protein